METGNKNRYIFFTSLFFSRNSRFKQLENFCLMDVLNEYVNPGKGVQMSEKSAEITKITDDFLKSKPLFKELAPLLNEFFNKRKLFPHVKETMISHNGFDFDFPLFLREMQRNQVVCYQLNKMNFFDTLKWILFDSNRESILNFFFLIFD